MLVSPSKNTEEWKKLENYGLTPSHSIPSDENYQLHHVNCVSVKL